MATRIVVALLAVAAVAPASAGAAEGTPFFPTPCGFSHRASDDPIVAPGRPGASHSHDFLGNHSTDAFSTEASLGAAGTACRRPHDRAAYWMPTLYSHGYAVAPARSQIYYQASGIRDVASIRPFPPGFKVIAGNAASQGAQSLSVVNWRCEGDAVAPQAAPPPSCPGDSRLRLQIRFPQCWDGQRTDSPDHSSHTAYASRGACPASHPVAVPRITLNVIYPLNRGDGIMLASGPAHTAHADFFNAWDQAELERLVSLCIHGRRGGTADCAAGASGPSPLAPLETGAPAVVHGATVLVHGRAGGRAGALVRIEAERRGAWSAVAEVLTVAGGRFSFSFQGRATGRYRAVGPEGRPTPPLRITVRPRTALAARPRRGAISLSARSRPMKRLIVVRIERLSGPRSRTVKRLVLRAERGRARSVVRVPRGRYRVRALTFGDSRHAAGRSAARDLSVR